MSVRNLLLIALVLAAASIRCSGSPAEPEGVVSITRTTSTTTSTSTSTSTTTTTTIPGLSGGAVGRSPSGAGLASATAFSFFLSSPPSGGVPPFTFAWNFGDGNEGGGSAPSHVYPNTGFFTAVATVTDSRGITALASSAPIQVSSATGRWTVTFDPSSGLAPTAIDIVQNQTAVTATINDPVHKLGTGTGNVSNPRSMSVSVTFSAGVPAPFAATYVGRIDDTIQTWIGTATGYPGCPCAFTASKPAFPGDALRAGPLP